MCIQTEKENEEPACCEIKYIYIISLITKYFQRISYLYLENNKKEVRTLYIIK